MSPPCWLMTASQSSGTLEEPCITKCTLGMRWWISLTRSMRNTLPVGSLETGQAAQLTLHRNAAGVREFDHFARNFDVVLVAGRGFAVFAQAAVHHHRAKARLDGAKAHARRGAVVLVHTNRDVRVHLDRGSDEVAQKGLTGIGACPGRALQNHRAVDRRRGLHDGLHLLQVVDVESRQAVAVFGGVVQQLTQ